jgi:N-acetylmuramoyl-L-alanine amidase
VRDLQRRLVTAGVAVVGISPGIFDDATSEAVASFQERRGLRTTGACDESTWLALVEAGWRLGDRVLLLAAPQLRGDDVVSLQQALNHLGFDCGRPDGILGPATIRALVDFQRNSGINADGVCGPITVSKLELLRRQSGSGPGVARIRERESVIGASTFGSLRVVVGQFGGLSAITRTVSRSLRQSGASVLSTDEYEAGAHASVANRFGATLYIGFEAQSDPCSTISYFAVPEFESRGGRALARRLTLEFDGVLNPAPTAVGMRLAVLRETRMPAVLCTLGPVRPVVDAAESIAEAVVRALRTWALDTVP